MGTSPFILSAAPDYVAKSWIALEIKGANMIPDLLRIVLALVLTGACLPGTVQERSSKKTPARPAIEKNDAGVELMKQDAFDEAVAAFRQALATDPSFNLARVNLGIALFYNHDLDGTFRTLSEADSMEPENPYVLFTLGLAYKNRGNSAKAAELFSRVTKIDPKCSATYYNLGVLYARQGLEKEAEAALRQSLGLDPNHTGALYNLGSLLVKSGRAAEGNAMLAKLRAIQKETPPKTGMGSGTGYGEMGRYAIAQGFL